jgi:arsenate reductase
VHKVLLLCTGNSARSIIAEVILNSLGKGRFKAGSAGSHPSGEINPAALALLARCGHETAGLRSKSWDEFALQDSAAFDYVITVCDNAANENCPLWSGNPTIAHWGIPDPASVSGDDDEIRRAFEVAYERLEKRIMDLIKLPLDSMSESDIQSALDAIGDHQEKN